MTEALAALGEHIKAALPGKATGAVVSFGELIERDRMTGRRARKRANDRLPQGLEPVVHSRKP